MNNALILFGLRKEADYRPQTLDMRTSAAPTKPGLGNIAKQRASFKERKATSRAINANKPGLSNVDAPIVDVKPKITLTTAQSLANKSIEANHAAHGITGARSSFNKIFGRLGKAIL